MIVSEKEKTPLGLFEVASDTPQRQEKGLDRVDAVTIFDVAVDNSFDAVGTKPMIGFYTACAPITTVMGSFRAFSS